MCDSARRKGWRGASARAYEYSIHTASGARDKSCRGRGSLLATTERRGRIRYARLRCGCGRVRLCAAQGVAGGRPGARMNTVFIQPRARATKVAAGESRLGQPPFGGGALAMPGRGLVAAVCDSARRKGWRGASARAYEYSIHTRLCGHSVFVAGLFRAFQSRRSVQFFPLLPGTRGCSFYFTGRCAPAATETSILNESKHRADFHTLRVSFFYCTRIRCGIPRVDALVGRQRFADPCRAPGRRFIRPEKAHVHTRRARK